MTNTEVQKNIDSGRMAAIWAIKEASGVDADQAEAILADAETEMVDENGMITTADAEAYLRRYTKIRFLREAELTRVKEQTQAMIKGLQARVAAIDWLMGKEAERLTRELLKGQKSKSIKLPHGTVGLRKTPGSLQLAPEKGAELMAWAKKHCPAAIVQPPPEIRKDPITEHILATGDEVPGATWVEPADKFYVK